MSFYLKTDVILKWKGNTDYYAAMERFVPYIAEKGLTLKYGLAPLIGDLRGLTHIWEAPTLEGLAGILTQLRKDPEAIDIVDSMKHVVVSEHTQVMMRTPYSR